MDRRWDTIFNFLILACVEKNDLQFRGPFATAPKFSKIGKELHAVLYKPLAICLKGVKHLLAFLDIVNKTRRITLRNVMGGLGHFEQPTKVSFE
jgi:hypothetical protein